MCNVTELASESSQHFVLNSMLLNSTETATRSLMRHKISADRSVVPSHVIILQLSTNILPGTCLASSVVGLCIRIVHSANAYLSRARAVT